jgi:large subunit ribosomal protein L23
MITSYDIIKSLLRTEKSSLVEKHRQYAFRVSHRSTKTDIRKAVEEIYKVKVQAVNIMHVPGKLKRVRLKYGYTSDWKKAVVTLKEGNKIEVG